MEKRSKYVNISDALIFQTRTDFLSHVLNNISGSLLDVGNLGDGVLNVDVRKIVENFDVNYSGLDSNQNLADKLGYKNQYIGDLHDLKNIISDESFDYIYAGEIIEHTWKPGQMISECNRILKPGGRLILDTPNAFSLLSVLRFYFKKKDTVGMDDPVLVYNEAKDNLNTIRNVKKEILTQPQHKIFYTPAMMRQLLNMHGFDIEKFVFIGKPHNKILRVLLKLFPQGGAKLGIVAKKRSLEKIFRV